MEKIIIITAIVFFFGGYFIGEFMAWDRQRNKKQK